MKLKTKKITREEALSLLQNHFENFFSEDSADAVVRLIEIFMEGYQLKPLQKMSLPELEREVNGELMEDEPEIRYKITE